MAKSIICSKVVSTTNGASPEATADDILNRWIKKRSKILNNRFKSTFDSILLSVILIKKKQPWNFFVYGYAKKDKANVNAKERAVYKDLAKTLLGLDEKTIKEMLKRGSLLEVK